MKHFFQITGLLLSLSAAAQEKPQPQTPRWQGKFEQLDQMLPTPNEYRTGSGSPGERYWQQQADYEMAVELNDQNQSITGAETITYYNNSPDVLKYLWLQLDQNILEKENNTIKAQTNTIRDSVSTKEMAQQFRMYDFVGGYQIKSVTDMLGKAMPYTINKTMMRIDLPTPLKSGNKYSFKIEWSFNINDRNLFGGRSGLEFFPEDGNYVYTIAQFFPRMCVYDDVVGWQNKQFLGQGEFALPFGNYKVAITVPADHIIGATGVLKNPSQVLTKREIDRLEKAYNTFDNPLLIRTQTEAIENEKRKSTEKKTWQFEANNVRDFAFASSRKFIWDAMAVKLGDKTTLAQSFYPKEGNPLWEKESTLAVKNTLEVYSKYTIDYPYPHATSVHAASIGMEYPMICFNFGRPKKDGTYDERILRGMLGVIIHEVGHNFFPMIINNDERQTTWMDEGINSFVQMLTQLERYPKLEWVRGKPVGLVPYMKGDKNFMRPLMTNSEQVIAFGSEQYTKAATALFILRETIMGKNLFDKSFKEYAQRWAFKHPKPADFFRTMEDASAVDLDWFWKGWFFTTDNVDISLDNVKWFKTRTEKSQLENKGKKVTKGDLHKAGDQQQIGKDFKEGPEYFSIIPTDQRYYGEFANRIDDKAMMSKMENKNFYEITITNKGGLVMPVIIEWTYKDGSKEIERLPAEIWRVNETTITKVFAKDKEVISVTLDPNKETTDIFEEDNTFPRAKQLNKFDELKNKNKTH